MKPQPESSIQEVLAGLVERVTFHNAENGFCVLRAKARGHRELVTVIGHAAIISAGEWITATGDWVNDRTHGLGRTVSMRQNDLTPLDLIAGETRRGLAMWTDDRRLAYDRNPQIWTVHGIDRFLECNKPCALWISAPNGEVPFCRRAPTIVGARLTERTSHSYFVSYRHGSLDLKVLR